MGLLSRKKTTPTLATPPVISAPLSNPILPSLPSAHAAKSALSGSTLASSGTEKSSQRGALGRIEGGGFGGALPSPPGSPIDPPPYPYKSAAPSSYVSQPRPQQQAPPPRSAVPVVALPGHLPSHASTSSYPSEQQRDLRLQSAKPDARTNPSGFSSDASTATNVLYNGNVAGSSIGTSAGTAVSEREVEGKMEKMGLDGVTASRRRASCMSVEMADGTPGTSLVGRTTESGRGATTGAAALSYPQQVDSPQRPILHTASDSTTSSVSRTSSVARKTASRYSLTDFTFLRTLGTGSFGRVHLVRSQHNSRSYAVKVLSKDRVVKMKQIEHTNSEREMLERVRHPFLVNLWGTFKDSKNLYMVMDFVAGGELFSLLRKSQRFPDPVAKFFAAEVALALDYLHSLDIIYRDLKPENILLGADGHVKITDFGFAKLVPDITWTLCGTPDYLAPEIVQSRGYNKSVDWYALGVLVFEMLAGYPPFFTEDSNPMRLYEKIIAGKVRYPAYFGPDAKDLLKSFLTPDLTKRFGNLAQGSRDIFTHVWFHEVDWERLYRKEIPAPYVPKVEGDWDASNFDQYPEVDLSEYGSTGPDPHGHHFLSF